jgi:hypothetical protein
MKINFAALKDRKSRIHIGVDIFMLFLILINLGLIIFEWHFQFEFFQGILESISPSFFAYYRDQVHPNFLLYDLIFVTIYLTELGISWIVAVHRKTYERWYSYPLVHWYDVLGCIPIGSFRWLRILRIVSLLIRMHRLKMIDITDTYLYKKGYKFYRLVMEEISDRVVIRIINGIEEEIKHDSPVTTQMVSEILEPHQETIARWISHRIKQAVEHNYNLHKDDMKKYIEESIGSAVRNNKEIKRVGAIPIVGKQITASLEHGVSNITYEAINGIVTGLTTEESQKVIKEAIHTMLESIVMREPDPELSRMVKDIFVRALDLVKQQVKVKKWKQIGTEAAVEIDNKPALT